MKLQSFAILLVFIFCIDYFFLNIIPSFISSKNEIQSLYEDQFYVEFRKLTPRNQNSNLGTIVIFPPTGGENIIDILYGMDLAANNYEVFILKNWTSNEISGYKYELHNVFYSSAQKALEKVIQRASNDKVTVLGTSVGALHASVALATNPQVKSGFLIVGGLSIPEIIVNSSQPAMQELKSKRYVNYNLQNDGQYLKELSEIFKFEPSTFPKTGKPVGMIISKNDKLVPYIYQENARKFFDAKSVYESSFDHFYTIVYYGFFKRKVIKDFLI